MLPTEPDLTPALASGADHRDEAEAILDQFVRFIRVIKRAGTRFGSQKNDGLEQAAYTILFALATDGPQRTTALAEAVRSDTSTVSRQVGALVRHGLVERQADPADGRACLLAATAHGRDCFDQHRKARVDEVARMLAHWSRADLQAAVAMLDRLNTEFESHEPAHSSGISSSTHLKAGQK